MKTLQECRDAIDSIDDEILNLLNKRMRVVERVGEIKHDSGTAIYRPEREKEIIDRLEKQSKESNGLFTYGAIEVGFFRNFCSFTQFRTARTHCLSWS